MSAEALYSYNSRGLEIRNAGLGILIPAIIFTSLRLFTRIHILSGLKADDYFSIGAVVCSVASLISQDFQVTRGGLGRHFMSLSLEELTVFLKCQYMSMIFYYVSMVLTKLSLLLNYLTLFPHPRVRLASKIAMGYVVCNFIYGIVFMILLCQPIAFFWDRSLKGSCIDGQVVQRLVLSYLALNIVSDIIIISIPMPVISKLRLPRKARLWLISVFALGFCVTVISIVRLPMLLRYLVASDISYDGIDSEILVTIEINSSIICAAVPPLRSFLQRYFPSLTPSLDAQPQNTLPHHQLHVSSHSGTGDNSEGSNDKEVERTNVKALV